MGRGAGAGACWPGSTACCAAWAWTTSTCGSCPPGTTRRPDRRDAGRVRPRRLLGARPLHRVSNFTGWQTAQAADLAARLARAHALVSTQVEYSLLQRGVEREVVPAVESLGLGVLAWSPLGRGILTGKYRHNTPTESRGASPPWQGFIDGLRSKKSDRIVEAVITAAEGLGTTPLAVALAWVRDRPGGGGAHRRRPHRPAAAGLAGLGGRAPARRHPHRAGGRVRPAVQLSRTPDRRMSELASSSGDRAPSGTLATSASEEAA